jgi:hypothetical protein
MHKFRELDMKGEIARFKQKVRDDEKYSPEVKHMQLMYLYKDIE